MEPVLKNLSKQNKNTHQAISIVAALALLLALLFAINTKKIIAEIRKNTVPW